MTQLNCAGMRVALLLTGLLAMFGTGSAGDNPSYSLEETIIEYDVDPSWPKRPDHVKPFGWVSGMALDDKEQIWTFNKGPDPVQVYTKDGTFIRTWGKG